MAHHGHGHYRHSRIGKPIKAKHQLEEENAGNADVEDTSSKLLGAVDTLESPGLSSSDLMSNDHCDPLKNVTCFEGTTNTPHVSLFKRQETASFHSAAVKTVQVVNHDSHTLLVSTAADFPTTISDPAFGAFTWTGTATVSAELSLLTPPASLLATPPATSTTQTTPLLTSKQTQTAPVSSPKGFSASSSIPYTSTPIVGKSSAVSSISTTSLPTTTSVYHGDGSSWYAGSSSSSSSWEGSYSSITSPASPSVSSGSEETGTGTGIGAKPSTSNSQPSSGSGLGPGSGSTTDATTHKIVGGVVGSVAGLAVLFLLLFYLLRRRKFFQQKSVQAFPSDDAGTRVMSERTLSNDNDPLFSASYFAPAFMKRWRSSTMTTATESTLSSSNTSERGFQKLSGRKIPPVLTHGGDGFGGGLGGDSPTLPGFSPISPGGGPHSSPSMYGPPPASPFGMPLDTNLPEADEITPTGLSPVHLPVSSSVNFGSPTTVIPSHTLAQPQSVAPVLPVRPDALGRSHPSHDGSRGSRFTESIDL
ncbi:hypothetical protein PENDEC_c002G05655 [Penicillium decumbens]|uniref:Uncharacterized protein n=1 Tax=Penicillium decumbens TaxID=69771 RepID=A0A1V6PLI3_PENDC|nr:hypothetical protein PENDEC_c002G05655 [Penicillium decumbens]